MQAVCGGDCPYISTNELESVHLRCRNEAIRSFKNAKKMGGPKLALQYMEKLEEDITVIYLHRHATHGDTPRILGFL